MLVCVKFHVVLREVWMSLMRFAEKEISQGEDSFPLTPSSTMLGLLLIWAVVVGDVRACYCGGFFMGR
jgi:CRISPR/Cas system-associated protein Cas5 (RAMP superfamily)